MYTLHFNVTVDLLTATCTLLVLAVRAIVRPLATPIALVQSGPR